MDRPRFETLTFARRIKAPPSVVFDAFESVEAREIWSSPHPSVSINYERADFRIGGRDVVLCKSPGEPTSRFEVVYERIDRPRLLIFTERLGQPGDPVSVALYTVEMNGTDTTDLALTIQIAALAADMIGGFAEGMPKALDHLVRHIEGRV